MMLFPGYTLDRIFDELTDEQFELLIESHNRTRPRPGTPGKPRSKVLNKMGPEEFLRTFGQGATN